MGSWTEWPHSCANLNRLTVSWRADLSIALISNGVWGASEGAGGAGPIQFDEILSAQMRVLAGKPFRDSFS
jgi:hypothetical protein